LIKHGYYEETTDIALTRIIKKYVRLGETLRSLNKITVSS